MCASPTGEPCINDDASWRWLQEYPAKAARWLGYLDFTAVTDERNAQPIIHRLSRPEPAPWVSIGVEVGIPDIDDIEPHVGVSGFEGRQPYHMVILAKNRRSPTSPCR
jgi:hypothetical protein